MYSVAVLALPRQQEVRLRNSLQHDARSLDQVGDSLFRNHPTRLSHHRRARGDAMAQAERRSVAVDRGQIHAVIDPHDAPSVDQVAAQHTVHVVVADADDLIQGKIQRARRQPLPGRPARGDVAFRMRALIGEEDLGNARAGAPPTDRD